jgi:FAD/FMN-containing dehydrogenase
VLPPERAPDALAAMLDAIARAGMGSFLAVLKEFGDRAPAGLLSFPRPGTTLALDFPNTGPRLFALLDRLDAIVADAGGALYPAKDARMAPAMFRASFPRLDAFLPYLDPSFSSGFWRRVMEPS